MKKIGFCSIIFCLCTWIAFTPASAADKKGYAIRDCPVMDEPYRDAQEIVRLEVIHALRRIRSEIGFDTGVEFLRFLSEFGETFAMESARAGRL